MFESCSARIATGERSTSNACPPCTPASSLGSEAIVDAFKAPTSTESDSPECRATDRISSLPRSPNRARAANGTPSGPGAAHLGLRKERLRRPHKLALRALWEESKEPQLKCLVRPLCCKSTRH